MSKHTQTETAPAIRPRRPKLIDTLWRSFAERVIPADAPTIQRMECRLAFYAGAAATFAATLAELQGCLTDDDIALIATVKAELDNFAADLPAERA